MMGQRLTSLGDGAATVAVFAAAFCLMVAVGAGIWQVVTRFLLSDPTVWSDALVRLSLIWAVMLGFPVALRHGSLVSIDVLSTFVPPKIQHWLTWAILMGIIAFCSILGWFGTTMTLRMLQQEMAGFEISIAWGDTAILVGCALGLFCAVSGHLVHRHAELEAER